MNQTIALGDTGFFTILRGPSPSAVAPTGSLAVHSPHTLFNDLPPVGFLDANKAAQYPRTMPDDILVAIAHPGKRYVYRVPGDREPFVPTNHWALVRVSSPTITSAEYLETWFLTPAFRAELDRHATGQTIQRSRAWRTFRRSRFRCRHWRFSVKPRIQSRACRTPSRDIATSSMPSQLSKRENWPSSRAN